jgi:triacylglycerol lipase
LNEALNDNLPISPHETIQRPEAARLPNVFSTRSSIRRHPPFLENLARSTLPTAQLTCPLPTSPHPLGDAQNDVDSTAIVIDQSPPSRTSVDSLRSLRDRRMGVTPETVRAASSSSTPSRWWYLREHKSSVDDLLDESDQAGTVEDEGAKIRGKCTLCKIYLSRFTKLTPSIQTMHQRTPLSSAMVFLDLIP